MARGYFRCLRHLPRAEIAEAELLKQAFVMKFLDGRQRRFDRRGAVRRHQIENFDLIGLQARQGLLEDSLQVLRFEDSLQVLRFVTGSVSGMNPRGCPISKPNCFPFPAAGTMISAIQLVRHFAMKILHS